MKDYFKNLGTLMKSWKSAIPITFFTLVRLFYGFKWVTGGIGKLSWLSDGELNSVGFITRMIENMVGEGARMDPFYINKFFAFIAENVFLKIPAVTDFLVVLFELGIGIILIIGFELLWGMVLATFLNLQFFAAGSTNNFGYLITNFAIMKWANYAEAFGLSGYLKHRKGKDLI